MGVGITASLLYEFPFNARWLHICAIVAWGCNLGLFGWSMLMITLRFTLFPEQFKKTIRHLGQSAFLGCQPMGLATIINATALICGESSWRAVYALWWIDVFFTLLSSWLLVFTMFCIQRRDSASTNATILLPVVALVVCGATGGFISTYLPESLQESTIIVSALLWGNGELLALSFIVIYLHRMLAEGLPPRLIAISSFLPVGPLGQGAFAVQNLTDGLCAIMQRRGVSEQSIEAVHYVGVSVAVILVGYASFWMFIGIVGLLYGRPNVFNMSWWGLTFPIGTYAMAWYKLAKETDIYAFKVLGAIWGTTVILTVLLCSALTLWWGIFHTRLFDQFRDETSPEDASHYDSDEKD